MQIKTKAHQVEQYVRHNISSGKWAAGEKLPPESELLAALGVSRTTLRSALTVLANEGMLQRRQKAGTFVAPAVDKGTVAILVPLYALASESCYYNQVLVKGIQRLAAQAGYRPVLVVGHGETEEEFLSSTHLFEKPFLKDTVGILSIVGTDLLDEPIRRANLHCVTIADPALPNHILLDNENLVGTGARCLKERGFDDFALMYNAPPAHWGETAQQRREKVLQWVRQVGVELAEERILLVPCVEGCDRRMAYDVFKDFWEQPNRPSAIFFADDVACELCIRAILELGISVPDDLAIITQANAGREIAFHRSLARLEFDPDEVVEAGWGMMQRLIESGGTDQECVRVAARLRGGESLPATAGHSNAPRRKHKVSY